MPCYGYEPIGGVVVAVITGGHFVYFQAMLNKSQAKLETKVV